MSAIDPSSLSAEALNSAMLDFKETIGWQVCMDVLSTRIHAVEEQMRTEKFEDVVEITKLQYKLEMYKELLSLPNTVIQTFLSGEETAEEDVLDPYHDDAKEIVEAEEQERKDAA